MLVIEKQIHGRCQRAPRISLLVEPAPARLGQLVIPRVAGLLLETSHSALVQRPRSSRCSAGQSDPSCHLERTVRDLLSPLGNRPAVLRFERYGLENQKVQCALRQAQQCLPLCFGRSYTTSCRSARNASGTIVRSGKLRGLMAGKKRALEAEVYPDLARC